ncbi:MAG: YceI family protein [Bacteroidia bacterium]|nr:YceI family protein [Bacteroidia bacterium]
MSTKLALLFTALIALSFTVSDIDKLTVDIEQSTVNWMGKKVTGKHTGKVAIKMGTLDYKKGKLLGGEFTMDMSSIAVTDLQGGMQSKLEGHLKSDDFFGITSHPEAKMVITQVDDAGAGTYDVTGDLTIKGITHPVTFSTLIAENSMGISATAKIVVDRTKYDIKYGSGKFFDALGDKMIYDDFELNINLLATK